MEKNANIRQKANGPKDEGYFQERNRCVYDVRNLESSENSPVDGILSDECFCPVVSRVVRSRNHAADILSWNILDWSAHRSGSRVLLSYARARTPLEGTVFRYPEVTPEKAGRVGRNR